MNVNAPTASAAPAGPSADAKPRNPEEAAKQFEAVFVRQFVQVMTKDLFDDSMAGENALGGGQADMQRDILTDTLTEHLVESGALQLSDLLLRQWAHKDGATPDAVAPAEAPDTTAPDLNSASGAGSAAPASSGFWESFGRGYTPPSGADDIDAD